MDLHTTQQQVLWWHLGFTRSSWDTECLHCYPNSSCHDRNFEYSHTRWRIKRYARLIDASILAHVPTSRIRTPTLITTTTSSSYMKSHLLYLFMYSSPTAALLICTCSYSINIRRVLRWNVKPGEKTQLQSFHNVMMTTPTHGLMITLCMEYMWLHVSITHSLSMCVQETHAPTDFAVKFPDNLHART